MLPASTKGDGTCFSFPDVCKTPAPPAPPVPIPYPNTGMLSQAEKTVDKVEICGKPVVTVNSELSRSSGDEAGTLKGMVSQTNMDKVSFKTGSATVFASGQKIVHLGATTGHNGSNANMPAGAQVAPSQTKVLVGP
ncbi:MAG: DUF4150 domain-containing protein [Deltaproteobacteria bacterium]|nr:DUF4150 domain-containing protein [Deltaproteobacteria bacterium]